MQQGSLPVFISQSFPVQPPVIGLVTLDRNSSQYYRDWGYSSILALHTRPLEKAKKAACVHQSDRGPKEKEKHGSLATADIVRAVAKNVGQSKEGSMFCSGEKGP